MEPLWLTNALFLSVSLAALSTVCWFVFKQIDFHVWKTPPGPIGLPLIGYGPFVSKDLHKDFARLNKMYGKICSVTMLSTRFVFVSDYDTAKELLCHPAALSRPGHIFDLFPGKAGFAAMNGKQWILGRKVMMQALRNVGLGKGPWIDFTQEEVLKMIDCISSMKGKPMDICTVLSQSALCNIVALVFGRRCLNKMTEHDLKVLHEGDKISKEEFQNSAFNLVFPWLLKYLIKFNIAGYANKKRLMNEAEECFRKHIAERINSTEHEDPADFITQYFEEVKKKTGCKTISDAHVECLVGTIATFINTTDTGMLATRWLLHLMAAYPEIQAKVHEEIDTVIGRNGTITWEERKKLPYVQACILEMERWVVVVPIFPPRCAEETFEFHGYCIPRGSIILTNSWALNRDSKYWNHPDEYLPERFLENNAEKLSSLEGYAPFSFGKRNCPGEKITMMITFFYFVGIMRRFEISTPSGKPDLSSVYNGSTLEPRDKYLCFNERK